MSKNTRPHSVRARAAEKPNSAAAPEPQPNLDELRISLSYKLFRFVHDRYWPTCQNAQCQRHRHCASRTFTCANAPESPPLTEAERMEAMVSLKRMIDQRLAELRQQEQ